jgi:hypothetical protein
LLEFIAARAVIELLAKSWRVVVLGSHTVLMKVEEMNIVRQNAWAFS